MKLNQLIIAIACITITTSCVNLKYTNYGRPFDFLKAKNDYISIHKKSNSMTPQLTIVEELSTINTLETIDTTSLNTVINNAADTLFFENNISSNTIKNDTIQPSVNVAIKEINRNEKVTFRKVVEKTKTIRKLLPNSNSAVTKTQSKANDLFENEVFQAILTILGIYLGLVIFIMIVLKISFVTALIPAAIYLLLMCLGSLVFCLLLLWFINSIF